MERRRAERKGRIGEHLAALSLRLRGFRILARRFRSPVGEVDLIARRGRLLLFVEVKTRPTLDQALKAIGSNQQQRHQRAAAGFLSQRPEHRQCDMRFDLIAIAPWKLPHHVIDAWRMS